MSERGQIAFIDDDGDGPTFTMTNAKLTIEIEEEQAVSSYNATVRTSCSLSLDDARKLLVWLKEYLSE